MRWHFFALLLPLLLASSGPAAAQAARPIEVEIKSGKVVGARTIQLHQSDVVTLRIATDTKVALHLHGYDIERTAEPGAPALFEFRARATGRYSISTIEAAAKGAKTHGHGVALLYLEVLPR